MTIQKMHPSQKVPMGDDTRLLEEETRRTTFDGSCKRQSHLIQIFANLQISLATSQVPMHLASLSRGDACFCVRGDRTGRSAEAWLERSRIAGLGHVMPAFQCSIQILAECVEMGDCFGAKECCQTSVVKREDHMVFSMAHRPHLMR